MSIPPSTISTSRLQLVRLTDTSEGSQHVQWFHENWSDPVATGWRYVSHLSPKPSPYTTPYVPPSPSTIHPLPNHASRKDTVPTSPPPPPTPSPPTRSPCSSR